MQKKIFGELTDLFVTYSEDAFSLTRDFVVKRCSKNVQKVQGKFKMFKERSKVQEKFNWFKSSIPLHFYILNATPYSLSKEGNLIVFIYFLYINYVRWGQSRYNFSNEKSLDWRRCSKNVQRFKKSSRVQIKQKKSTRLCSFLAFWT